MTRQGGEHSAGEVGRGVVIDGRYELLDVVGRGGFGRVFRARQRSTGQQVALKLFDTMLQPGLVHKPGNQRGCG